MFPRLMRVSRTLVPTLKEVPAEAEVPSHQLMLRGGLIRKLSSGIYSYLPIGLRVLQKASQIVREEMDRAGAIEILMPVLQPTEIWKESGRYTAYTATHTMFVLKDRKDAEQCLGPTHEEVVTDIVRREIRSYRQLPVNLYQIQTKFRDELRPRFGLIRGREFLMKDAYSFDRDDASLDKSFRAMANAYHRIFRRMGLRPVVVEADSGAIGGSVSSEFMVPSPTGEDSLASCGACGYGANVERAEAKEIPPADGAAPAAMSTVDTPGKRTIEEVTGFLGKKATDLIKTLVYVADGKPVVVLARGDVEVNEVKLRNKLGCIELSLADAAVVERVTKAPVGFAGPVGLSSVPVFADRSVPPMKNAVTGANAVDKHHVNVNPGRDFPIPEALDLHLVREGDLCPRCGKPMSIAKGLEVGHVFKLGTKYSIPMKAVFSDEDGTEKPCQMGCYGLGVSRCLASAVEQNHDAKGMVWPVSLAPYEVALVATSTEDAQAKQESERIHDELTKAGIEVLFDDRPDASAGVKFKDADLIGLPLQVVVGPKGLKDGIVEVRPRATGASERVPLAQAVSHVKGWVEGERQRLRREADEGGAA